ncbi:hypothetical protein P5V15_013853 [Pogonomyrmex californicus]
MEEDIALERQFKPIVKPLIQIVENTGGEEPNYKMESNVTRETKRKRSQNLDDSLITSTPRKRSNALSDVSVMTSVPINVTHHATPYEQPSNNILPIEDVFETTNESLVMSVRRQLQTSEGLETLQNHFGPLGQKYMGAVLTGNKDIDNVYGVYFTNDGLMLGDKRFDVSKDDNIFINGIFGNGRSLRVNF